MEILKKWPKISLIKRIVVFLVIGTILALLWPGNPVITLLGTLFVAALKAIAPMLVFFLIMSALANAHTDKSMRTVIILYVISMLIAAFVSCAASFLFPMTLTFADASDISKTPPSGVGEVMTNLLTSVVSNPVDALVNANYIGLVFWSVLLGIALRRASMNTKDVFTNVSTAVTQLVQWIIQAAPFGILGLIYNAISENGPEIFIQYGQIILLLVCVMFFVALVTNPILVFITTRTNPYPLVLTALRESGLTAFFTRSSAANIPVNINLCRKLGLNPNNYSVSIPLGATINMAGAAVTITVMTLAAAHTLGISVDMPTALILSVLAVISSCGASGVAGGSLLLIPLACSLFGISNDIAMQVVAIGFIIGVIQDSCETALNSSSDVIVAAAAELHERRLRGEDTKLTFSSGN